MKTLLCSIVVLFLGLCCFSTSANAQYCQGYVYLTSLTFQTPNSVQGYSSTELDYCAGLYYDPATWGRFSEGNFATENVVMKYSEYTQGYADWIPAEIYYNFECPVNGRYYNVDTTHYVIEYYLVYQCFGNCGYYWYDPWQLGFLEGGGGYEVPGGYGFYVFYWIAAPPRAVGNSYSTTIFSGQTQCGGNPSPTPTPTPTPPPVDPTSGCSTGYTSLGGVITSEPTAGVVNNKVVAFARGTDNVIYYQHSSGGNFSGWLSLAGGTYQSPKSTVINGTLYLEVVGTDNNNYYKSSTDGVNFSNWVNGTVEAETSPSADFNGFIYDFARGEGVSQPALCVKTSPVLETVISSVEFEIINSPIDANPGNGVANTNIGLRMYPEKTDPNDNIDRAKVRVRANIFPAQANKKIYFKTYDMDDPSANILPLDDETKPQDNRGDVGGFRQGVLSVTSAITDSSGIATTELTVTKQPGDNFAVAASRSSTYLGGAKPIGNELKNGVQTIPISPGFTTAQNPAMRTPLLTVWRKLHIEVDSMGQVPTTNTPGANEITGSFQIGNSGSGTIPTGVNATILVTPNIEEGRFKNGRITFGANYSLPVVANSTNSVTIANITGQGIGVNNGQTFTIYDDDDYNASNGATPNGDSGEAINELADTFYYLRPNDLFYSDGTPQNAFRLGYIMPEYEWAKSPSRNYNQANITFELNGSYTLLDDSPSYAVINQHRDSSGDEKDDFWIAYFVLGYQGMVEHDFDGYMDIGPDPNNPNGRLIQPESGHGGITPKTPGTASNLSTCDCLNGVNCPTLLICGTTPKGSNGSIIFQEVDRDIVYYYKFVVASRDIAFHKVVATHELGHQFALKGDNLGNTFSIMDYPNYDAGINSPIIGFHPHHLNIIRNRTKSPGQ